MDTLKASDAEAAAVATAPRVTLEGMQAKIVGEHYFTVGEALTALGEPHCGNSHGNLDIMTLCVLVTESGFNLVGESAPASAANFDAELGRKFAYENAIRQLWKLEGYALRDRLAAEGRN